MRTTCYFTLPVNILFLPKPWNVSNFDRLDQVNTYRIICQSCFPQKWSSQKEALFCIFNLFLQGTSFFSSVQRPSARSDVWKVMIDVRKISKDTRYTRNGMEGISRVIQGLGSIGGFKIAGRFNVQLVLFSLISTRQTCFSANQRVNGNESLIRLLN